MKPARHKNSGADRAVHEPPPAWDWRTTDAQEVEKRRRRALEETFKIRSLDARHPIFTNFEVYSPSGMTYRTEIRDLLTQRYACDCADFRSNGLGTCKHIEAVLNYLQKGRKFAFKLAERTSSDRIDIVPCPDGLQVERGFSGLPEKIRAIFDEEGILRKGVTTDKALLTLSGLRSDRLRISQEVEPSLASLRMAQERRLLRREYELGIQEGRYPLEVTSSALFPYQREGMLHLAFGERALLADEMGLGKTIQAIAACLLLHHLGKVSRVLVVTPASLKAEWEEQIKTFTHLGSRLIYGNRHARAGLYTAPNPPFFTIVNYEQVVADSLDINASFRPDVVVLDEAQRIKNWATKTAQAIKRLKSRYAFVLSGTPIENRIDELHSLVEFLDPMLLGPLFRFNREYYIFDERGRPNGYKNLAKLRERIAPLILRRRKRDVETQLPNRTDQIRLVSLTPKMRQEYAGIEQSVGELVQKSKRRALTPKEQDLLMILLNMLRMICDSPSLIKNHPCTDCPKLAELTGILQEVLIDPEVKVIIFSEWEGMVAKVRDWAKKSEIRFAWHTGSVPQQRRRAEILTFRSDPNCRLFISTDSGGVGLNLQNASVVINCDLPWNPAKLEQRIARAWRKNQLRPVTVINLVADKTIEHGMIGSLKTKMELLEGVMDGIGDLANIRLKTGVLATLKRLEQLLIAPVPTGISAPSSSDPSLAFALAAKERFGEKLTACRESWLPNSDTPVLLTVVRDATPDAVSLAEEMFRDTQWERRPAPTLQIVDNLTWETMRKLAAAGMISFHFRAGRDLLPVEGQSLRPPLTPEQLARITELRKLSAKKRRAAEALIAAGLPDEAEPLAQAANEAEAAARAIEDGVEDS